MQRRAGFLLNSPVTYVRKPTREDVLAAAGKTIPDLIAPDLRVLFCGINPGLYSAATGFHFARPGNRFWPTLYAAGFTDRLLFPFEEYELLKSGYGITNLVERSTASADELSKQELISGGRQLEIKVREYRPKFIAMLGVGAYRSAFGFPKAKLGLQDITIGKTRLWVLPSPSGLNAHYQLKQLVQLFQQLRFAAQAG